MQAGVEWEWGRAGGGLQGQGPCRGRGEHAEPPALLKLPGPAAQCSAGLPVDVLGPSETEEPGRGPPANPLHPAGTMTPGDTLGLLHHQWGPPHPKPSCLQLPTGLSILSWSHAASRAAEMSEAETLLGSKTWGCSCVTSLAPQVPNPPSPAPL